jgi:hypothetical protein
VVGLLGEIGQAFGRVGVPATDCQLGQHGLGGELENRCCSVHFGPNETFGLVPLAGA